MKFYSFVVFLTLCRFTLCRVFDRLSFDPRSFYPMSSDPMAFDPRSFDPMSVNLKGYRCELTMQLFKHKKPLENTLTVPLNP